MKEENDFSGATLGKFSRPDAQLISPVHLEPDVLAYLAERGKARGVSIGALANDILKKDIALFEAVKSRFAWPASTPSAVRGGAEALRRLGKRSLLAT